MLSSVALNGIGWYSKGRQRTDDLCCCGWPTVLLGVCFGVGWLVGWFCWLVCLCFCSFFCSFFA